jgi:hypothetical protein
MITMPTIFDFVNDFLSDACRVKSSHINVTQSVFLLTLVINLFIFSHNPVRGGRQEITLGGADGSRQYLAVLFLQTTTFFANPT